ncbi:hypothetical protein LZ554_005317 [Drepanopeziza brunnea f. sp. 'monogermtubi']|nr:hypothetical protein LZ554_005317 [Drepanopeziza brunnea f. sp. 'monogermtubi']
MVDSYFLTAVNGPRTTSSSLAQGRKTAQQLERRDSCMRSIAWASGLAISRELSAHSERQLRRHGRKK